MKHGEIPKEDFESPAEGCWLKAVGCYFNRLFVMTAISLQPALSFLRRLHLQHRLSVPTAAQYDEQV